MLLELGLLMWLVQAVVEDDPDVLAQGAPLPVNPSLMEQYGPGGVVGLLAMGLSWAAVQHYKELFKLEREEKLAAQAELRELNKTARELMMPALTLTRDALTQATVATTEALKVLRKDHPL